MEYLTEESWMRATADFTIDVGKTAWNHWSDFLSGKREFWSGKLKGEAKEKYERWQRINKANIDNAKKEGAARRRSLILLT